MTLKIISEIKMCVCLSVRPGGSIYQSRISYLFINLITLWTLRPRSQTTNQMSWVGEAYHVLFLLSAIPAQDVSPVIGVGAPLLAVCLALVGSLVCRCLIPSFTVHMPTCSSAWTYQLVYLVYQSYGNAFFVLFKLTACLLDSPDAYLSCVRSWLILTKRGVNFMLGLLALFIGWEGGSNFQTFLSENLICNNLGLFVDLSATTSLWKLNV